MIKLLRYYLVIISFFLIPLSVLACNVNISPSQITEDTPTTVTLTITDNSPYPLINFNFTDTNHLMPSFTGTIPCPWGGTFFCSQSGYDYIYNSQIARPSIAASFTVNAQNIGTYTFTTSGGNNNCQTLSLEVVTKSLTYLDSGVSAGLATAVGSFATGAKVQLLSMFGIGFLLLVTILLVFKSIHWFMEIASGKGSSLDEQFGSSFNSTSPKEFNSTSAKTFISGQANVFKDYIKNNKTKNISFGAITYAPYKGFYTSQKQNFDKYK